MGHSYVEYRRRDLLMHDIEIVTVVSVVLDAVRNGTGVPRVTPNVKRLLESWENLFDAYGPGCLGFSLDEFVRTEEDRMCLRDLFELAANWLGRQGAVVSGEYLDRIVGAPGVLEFQDRPVADILVSFEKFRDLLVNEVLEPQ
jgi:hypothetical protein